MCDLYPEADIFVPVMHGRGIDHRLAHRNVQTSFLQRLRPTSRTFRALLPLYPAAIESFDLTGYDVVVSSSSAWAHAVISDEDAVHVCYCHNPFRYAWNERHRTIAERADPITRAALRGFFRRWREWDWIAAQRVDRYVTNSRMTQGRIETFFGRSSTVVHPPVSVGRFEPGPVGEHYVVLSELISHKQIDIAVEAFTRLGLPLVVIGDGPERRALERSAGPRVRFVGRVDDHEVERLVAGARALVSTGMEEFGIAAVEAQAAGRPVIARSAGGALETVVDGRTGCFWEGGAAELVEAVRGFDALGVDPAQCVANARRFDREVFRRRLSEEVDEAERDKRLTPEPDPHPRVRRPGALALRTRGAPTPAP